MVRTFRTSLRALVALTALLAVLLALPTVARAGSYLDRAAMLLDSSKRENAMLRSHLTDKDLARLVSAIADARVRAASRMAVAPEVTKAHPHLLLALEHAERAASAAAEGSLKVALGHLDDARREEESFRAVLKELGHALPTEGPRARRLRPR